MRLWSIHPCYLDTKGLVALWREGLLAQKVLQGRTRGYRAHPQLRRFQKFNEPNVMIASYLNSVLQEGVRRGYKFDARKIPNLQSRKRIAVTSGQMKYEFKHLLRKLWFRDRSLYRRLADVKRPKCHPIFSVKPGEIEDWEVL